MKKITKILIISSLFFNSSCSFLSNTGNYLSHNELDTNGGLTKGEIEKNLKEEKPNQIVIGNIFKEPNIDRPFYKDTQNHQLYSQPVFGGFKVKNKSIKHTLDKLNKINDLNISYSPKIRGKVSMNLKNSSVFEVLEKICDLGDLRYSFEDGNVYIEPDSLYDKIYITDFLNSEESWNDIEGNINLILNKKYQKNYHDKIIKPKHIYKNIAIKKSVSQDLSSKDFFEQVFKNPTEAKRKYKEFAKLSGVERANEILKNRPDNIGILRGFSVPFKGDTPARKSAKETIRNLPFSIEVEKIKRIKKQINKQGKPISEHLKINKSSKTIYIIATRKHHKKIQKYLDITKKILTSQVEIEAKFIEVTLKKEFSSGINWNRIGEKNTISNNGGTNPIFPASSGSLGVLLGEGVVGNNLTAAIKLLETFGTTRSISSPKIIAKNGITSKLEMIEKLPYFEVNSTTNSSAVNSGFLVTGNVETEKRELITGTILEVKPSINIETQEITLELKPRISKVSGTINDPSTNSSGTSLNNTVPYTKDRKINVTAVVKSGDVLVIGGMLSSDSDNSDSGVPFFQRIPILGWIFKSFSKSENIVETVIFVKATLKDSSNSVSARDRKFNNIFDQKGKYFSEKLNLK